MVQLASNMKCSNCYKLNTKLVAFTSGEHTYNICESCLARANKLLKPKRNFGKWRYLNAKTEWAFYTGKGDVRDLPPSDKYVYQAELVDTWPSTGHPLPASRWVVFRIKQED